MTPHTLEFYTIPGFDGYCVSSAGDVFIHRMMASHINHDGYEKLQIVVETENGTKKKNVGVHQLICRAFKGLPPSDKHEVRHLDGNPRNNAPSNLAWGTHKENCADQKIHGTSNRGSRRKNAKLREVDIPAIRRSVAEGVPQREIAEKFSVHVSVISNIKTGRIWSHVE